MEIRKRTEKEKGISERGNNHARMGRVLKLLEGSKERQKQK
jgi:hypothetical protein